MECVLDNITIHYEAYGDGKPIISIPGWTLNARLSAHYLEPILQKRTGWRRIYIDPPGHGKSPSKDWIKNQDNIFEIVLACIDKLTDGKNFALIGTSLGAYLARGVLLKRTNLVDGIAMLIPVAYAEDEKRTVPPYQVLIEDDFAVGELSTDEKNILGMSVIRTRSWLSKLRAEPKIPADESGDTDFLSAIRVDPKKYALSFNMDALPQPYQKPALIIAGRQDDNVGYSDMWKMLGNYPRASYVVLDRMGHLMEEKDALINVLMNEWLDRVDENSENT